MGGTNVFYRVIHARVRRGRGPNVPQIFWDSPTYSQTVLTYVDKNWYGNTCGGVACFYGSVTALSMGQDPSVPKILEPLGTPIQCDLEPRNLVW